MTPEEYFKMVDDKYKFIERQDEIHIKHKELVDKLNRGQQNKPLVTSRTIIIYEQ